MKLHKSAVVCSLFFLIIILLPALSNAQITNLKGEYLGQGKPGKMPKLFAPGIVSTSADELNASFSPDGKTFLYSMRRGYYFTIFKMEMNENGYWTKPVIADFSGKYSEADPVFNKAGTRLYFCSTRQASDTSSARDFNTAYIEKRANGWSEPYVTPFSTNDDEFYISFTEDESEFYFHKREKRILNLYMVTKTKDGFTNQVKLPEGINTDAREWDPLIAPDGSYILFSSNRDGNLGRGDLYVAFRNDDGTWSEALNLGPEINSTRMDYCPQLSHDGKFLFYSSYKYLPITEKDDRYETDELVNKFRGPGNGFGDIYWVSSEIIEDLRKEMTKNISKH